MSGSRRSARKGLALVLCVFAASCDSLVPSKPEAPELPTQALTWTFTADPAMIATGGVVGAQAIGSTVYLYLSGAQSTLVSSDGGATFSSTPVTFTNRPFGRPVSFVALPDGRQRAYFVSFDQATNKSSLSSSTSTNGRAWTSDAGSRFEVPEFTDPWTTVAGGPNGPFRAFAQRDVENENQGEPINSASSSDGLTFTPDAGMRIPWGIPGQWRQPSVLYVGGEWLMAIMKGPRFAQESSGTADIWLATSSDGLAWTMDTKPLVTLPGGTVGNPALVSVNGTVRLYYAAFPGQNTSALLSAQNTAEARGGTLVKR